MSTTSTRHTARNPKTGMDAEELSLVLEDATVDASIRVDVGFRGQIKAITITEEHHG